MNYSQLAKNEVVKLKFGADCCRTAFLSAVIHSTGSVVIRDKTLAVEIVSENEELLEKTSSIIIDFYGFEPIKVGRKLILSGDAAMLVMHDVGIFRLEDGHTVVEEGILPSLVESDCCVVNYIRGVFLGAGSISAKAGYHLEFGVSNPEFAADFSSLLERFSLPAKTIVREKKIIVYLKGSETVCDCLALTGASKAVIALNDELAIRDVRRRSNRVNNCEYANIGKTVDAAVRQIEAIKKLKKSGQYELLPEKLIEVAECRTDNPELSLAEISSLTGIARSTVKNRLNKIVELAENTKEKN